MLINWFVFTEKCLIFVSAALSTEGPSGTMQVTWCGWLGLWQSHDSRIS